jgi:hypothetical protein
MASSVLEGEITFWEYLRLLGWSRLPHFVRTPEALDLWDEWGLMPLEMWEQARIAAETQDDKRDRVGQQVVTPQPPVVLAPDVERQDGTIRTD